MHAAVKNRQPGRRWDHLLPAMLLVVGGGLLEVWASWLTIASVSGFPRVGRMTTGWILPVTTEAYWTVALFAWLVIPAGPRSRKFAMWSAAGVFAASLTGQESGHLVAAAGGASNPFVVGLVTALPLTAVALGAILIHLRQQDWEEADTEQRAQEQAAQRAAELRAEADDRTALRAELATIRDDHATDMSALRETLEAEQTARATAQRDHAEALARAEKAEQKLAAASAQKKRAKGGRNARDADLTTELRAIRLLDEEPELKAPRMGAELGRKLGVSEQTGRRLHSRLTAQDRPGEALKDAQ